MTSDEGGGDGGADDPPPSPLEWAFLHRRIDDRPFSLAGFRPLREIYEDDHPFIVVRKPAQVGLSELAVTKACHALDVGARYWDTGKQGINVGYIFSTDKALSSFSKERFSGLRLETDKLANLFTQYDAVGFKQAGHSYLFMAGGKSTAMLKSFAADFLIFDEFDEMTRALVALAEKRLKGSHLKRQMRLSTPTLPNYGIDELYQQSDQRAWETGCGACNGYAELDFWRDVRADAEPWDVWKDWEQEVLRQAGMTVACPLCRRALDPLGEGRWLARRPEIKGIRGYAVPALAFASVSLNQFAVNAVSNDSTVVTEFYRSDLGLPYEPAGSRVTDTMLRQLSHQLEGGVLPRASWSNTTMGVDVGAWLHYRVSSTGPGGKRYVRAMGRVRDWAELDALMRIFQVRHCVIDALPELHACQAWAAKYPGRVLRAFYPNASAMQGRLFRTAKDEPKDADVSEKMEANTVRINRTMAMDTVYSLVAAASEAWPERVHNDPEVAAHMKAPVRVVFVDENGQSHTKWEHTSPDHLFHACVYDVVAYQTLPRSNFVGVMPYTGEEQP